MILFAWMCASPLANCTNLRTTAAGIFSTMRHTTHPTVLTQATSLIARSLFELGGVAHTSPSRATLATHGSTSSPRQLHACCGAPPSERRGAERSRHHRQAAHGVHKAGFRCRFRRGHGTVEFSRARKSARTRWGMGLRTSMRMYTADASANDARYLITFSLCSRESALASTSTCSRGDAKRRC